MDRAFQFRCSIRLNFCPTCHRRPTGSHAWSPLVVRHCERECTLFAITPEVVALAGHRGSDARLSLENILRAGACMDCHTCGPNTADGEVACVCPLRLDDEKVDRVLDTLATPACGAD